MRVPPDSLTRIPGWHQPAHDGRLDLAPVPPNLLEGAKRERCAAADDVTATVNDEGAAVEISRWFPQDS